MAFVHLLTVRFFEIDRAGIAFFGRFFEYCHAAFEEMLAAAFGDMEKFFVASNWGMPLVHAEADFKTPVRMGDRLRIELSLARLGDTSVTFSYRISGADGALRATAQLKHAFIDRKTFAPCAVPADFAERLRRIGVTEEQSRQAP